MSKIKKIVTLVATLVFILVLSACNKGLNIDVEMTATGRRDIITVSASFIDNEKRIFADGGFTPVVSVYVLDDNNKKGDRVDYAQLQIADGTKPDINTTAKTHEFTDLETNKTYLVELTITHDGKQEVFASENVTTESVGTKENPVEISTLSEFKEIKYDRYGYYKLTADIDFSEGSDEKGVLEPFFTSSNQPFEGTIDGNGFKISNFKLSKSTSALGIVGYNKGTIKNLTIENVEIDLAKSSDICVGLIAGYSEGYIQNNTVRNVDIIVKSNTYSLKDDFIVGGIVGSAKGGYRKNDEGVSENYCVSNNTIENLTIKTNAVLDGNVGGLIGEVLAAKYQAGPSALKVENNKMTNVSLEYTGEIKTQTSEDVVYNVGGLIGYSENAKISNNIVDVDLTVKATKADGVSYEDGLKLYRLNVGGLVGSVNVAKDTPFKLEQTVYDGSISVDAQYVYDLNVAGAIANVSSIQKFILNNIITNVTSLELIINTNGEGIEETETKEDESVEAPKYTLSYGLVFAKYTGVENLNSYLEEKKIYTLNDVKVEVNESQTIVPVVTEKLLKDKTAITATNGFSEFIIDYFKN